MPKDKNSNQYVTVTKLYNNKEGLLALKDIPKNTVIAEYKGRLNKPSNNYIHIILFSDGSKLYCTENCITSKVSDCIKLPEKQRSYQEFLNAETLYETEGTGPNVKSRVRDNVHRAELVSIRDIKKGEGIYIHYGIRQVAGYEANVLGFLDKDNYENDKFNENTINNYIKTFYPNTVKIEPLHSDFLNIIDEDGDAEVIPIKNISKVFRYYKYTEITQ